MNNFKGALDDALLALKEIGFALYPLKCALYPLALLARADAFYYLGRFEPALLDYHAGQKLRPDMKDFRLGIQRTEATISSSITNAKEWDRLGLAEELCAKKYAISKQYSDDSDSDGETRKKNSDTQRKDKDKFLLEGLYEDKVFLLDLQSEQVMMDADEGRVGVVIDDALAYLASRSDFWAARQLPISRPQPPKSRPASARAYSRPQSGATSRPQSATIRFSNSESAMVSRYVRPQSASVSRARPSSAAMRTRPQSALVGTRPLKEAPPSVTTPLYARNTSASSLKSISAEQLAKARSDSGYKMAAWEAVPTTMKERFEKMKRVYSTTAQP
jgi:hypothetical protein